MANRIIPPGSGDPRLFAARHPFDPGPDVHGLTPGQIEELHARYDQMLPKFVSSDPEFQKSRALEDEFRRAGVSRSPFRRTAQIPSGNFIPGATNPGRGTLTTPQMPYQPEFSSPDRQQYPVHRVLANRYWRLFHKLDPVIGNAIDLFSEMPWSDYQLVGEGVDGEVKQHYEAMCEEVALLSLLPYVVREYFVTGEAIIHNMYDAERRMWNYCTLHNPDQIEVVDAPFIHMDPIIEMIPDQRLRAILSSGDPMLQRVRAQIPPELLSRLLARQNVPLDNLNVTFLARKLHPYDVRGTSIISRLWRVLMLEDGIFSATIATARRHAGPIKIAKIGNPQTGWIPGPEHEQRLLELLAQAEVDPHAFIVYHFGVQFEAFGTTDRVISVGREWETLERIKLIGLGISKSFVTGEVTYASSVTGLQVFLQRLLSLRNHISDAWLTPKFFRPIAEINEFIKPTTAEVTHRVKVRRTAQQLEEENRYIVPRIDWNKKLDPNVDRDLVSAMESLERIGVKISKKAKLATIGLKYEDELRASLDEEVLEAKERQRVQDQLGPAGKGPTGATPSDQTVEQFQDQQQGPDRPGPTAPPGPGQPGGPPGYGPPARPGAPPPANSTSQQPQRAANDPSQPPEPQQVRRPMLDDEAPPRATTLQGDMWRTSDRFGNWTLEEAEAVVGLMTEGRSDEAFWTQAASERLQAAVAREDREEAWEDLQLYLEGHGYPDRDIQDLRKILLAEQLLQSAHEDEALAILDALPEDVGDDRAAEAAFVRAFSRRPHDDNGNGAVTRFSTSLFVGEPTAPGGGGRVNPFRRSRRNGSGGSGV